MTADLTPLDVLRERGWCKDGYEDEQDRVCILGAHKIAKGASASRRDDHVIDSGWCDAVSAVIREQFPDRPDWVDAFNDFPATTFADVELVLEKAQIRYDEAVR